jgi:Protein of unknown function (DUF4065)
MGLDRQKLKALTHYVIWRAGHREGFGAAKLNKVLWFADARSYMMYRHPITGATYVREKHGPVPREIMSIRSELASEGRIAVTTELYYSGEITRFKALETPDVSIFSEEEMNGGSSTLTRSIQPRRLANCRMIEGGSLLN